MDKLFNSSKVPNQTNQFQTQIMIERSNPLLEPIERGIPLLELTREPRKMEEKRPVLRRSIHILFTKKAVNNDRTGQPVVETGRIQTRSSDDSKSLNVEMAQSSQSSQPNPNPDHDRTGKPVVCRDISHAQGARKTSRSQEIETRSFHEETVKHDRTGKPVVCRDASYAQDASQTRSSHESTNFNVEDETNHDRTGKPVVCRDASPAQGLEQSMLNEADIDFRIPGLPHSVVKQAENSRVRELVKKIENHPRRQSLQRDLQQKQCLQPVQQDVKENDSGRGQRRAVWTVRDGP